MRLRARARWLALCLSLTSACAGGRSTECADDSACPTGTLCQLDGSCRPLSTSGDDRFARHARVEALDWGSVRRDQPRAASVDADMLPLGGDERAALHLAFGPLPSGATLLDVVLTLHLVPSAGAPPGPRTFEVAQTRPFAGHHLTYRSAPPSTHAMVQRRLEAAGGRSLHLALGSPTARRDRGGHRNLYVVVRTREHEGPPLLVASPRTVDPALRPHIDVRLH